jgi:hypothetical protein
MSIYDLLNAALKAKPAEAEAVFSSVYGVAPDIARAVGALKAMSDADAAVAVREMMRLAARELDGVWHGRAVALAEGSIALASSGDRLWVAEAAKWANENIHGTPAAIAYVAIDETPQEAETGVDDGRSAAPPRSTVSPMIEDTAVLPQAPSYSMQGREFAMRAVAWGRDAPSPKAALLAVAASMGPIPVSDSNPDPKYQAELTTICGQWADDLGL